MDTRFETENGNVQDVQISLTLQYLAPWVEKTDGLESVGAWENNLATKMMVKLLELWITPESREEVEKVLEYYHPLDRAAMAYALVVYVLTGKELHFKSAMATQHYKRFCKMLKEDMPQLMFANHMKYMVRRYGPKKIKH
ncbi:hypothetical protein SAMN04488494_0277 [Xylanibacter ruminicola]|uniref:Uncharacterized protein n=1 Tax=Xylanibacter ruminicola TaxID=839 RepID=A0A1M7P0D5_XYLRU|nr:hypothetical protein [Xylanibacter ruminicola]SHN09906.1 hypothetical protein SAMN04488494_0277 [Xylanibacter ruminicola]